MRVTVNLPVRRALLSRGLGGAGEARQYLCRVVRQRCDKYVPMDTGRLKNSAYEAPDGSRITYPQPYGAAQFYRPYRHRDPNRGDHWHRRMLTREGKALTRQLGRYLEGRKP